MKRGPIITIVAVVVLALIALGVYLAGQRQPTTTPSTTPTTSQPSTNTGKNSNQNQTQSQNTPQTSSGEVAIRNFAFNPASLTVKKGATVKWTNYDDMAHTVVESDNKTGPSSSLLAKNQTYSFTYNEVGTFAYKCSVHPNMTGVVTVTE